MAIVKGEIVQEDPVDNDMIFTEKTVNTTTDVLARLLRHVFVTRGITNAALRELHREYMQKLCATSNTINFNWNNIKKAIVKDTITFHMFHFIIVCILNCHIERIDLSIVDTSGTKVDYSLDL